MDTKLTLCTCHVESALSLWAQVCVVSNVYSFYLTVQGSVVGYSVFPTECQSKMFSRILQPFFEIVPVVFTTCATYKFDYLLLLLLLFISCLKTGGSLQREISQWPVGRFGLPLNNNLTRRSYNIASFFKNYNIESRRIQYLPSPCLSLSVFLPNNTLTTINKSVLITATQLATSFNVRASKAFSDGMRRSVCGHIWINT